MRILGIPSSEIFRKVITEYSKLYELSECLYIGTIKEFMEKDLDKLTEIDAKRILEPFFVILAEAGILSFQSVTDGLGFGFHRRDAKRACPLLSLISTASLYPLQ